MNINAEDLRKQPGAAAVAATMAGGGIAGVYPTQNDLVADTDNCDATHPLNLDFLVPNNFQRVTSLRLSFKLRAVRMVTHNHVVATAILRNAGAPVSVDEYGTFDSAGNQGLVVLMPTLAALSGAASFYTDSIGAVGQVKAIIDGPVAAGVSVALDGTDITAKLGGPFSADQTELDLGPSLGGSPKAGLHLVTLTPNALGRIRGILRLTYVVNPGVR